MTNHKPFKCFKVNVWLKKNPSNNHECCFHESSPNASSCCVMVTFEGSSVPLVSAFLFRADGG